MSQGQTVVRNVGYNFLAQVWFIVLPLATSPFIVRHLGVEKYGVLSLATAIVGYLAVLDMGMGTATIKYIADHYSQRDYQSISKVVGTSIVIYSGLGLLGTLLIAACAKLVVTHLLHVPVELVSLTLVVFYISSFGFLVNMPLTVFNSIPNALQRFDILVRQNLVLGTLAILSQVLLLSLGYSLKAIVAVNVAISLLGIGIFVAIARRLLPEVSFRPIFDRATARQILGFSTLKVFSVISGQIVFQLDKVLIAAFLPLSSVSYYVIPLGLAQRIISVIPNITTAVFPAVSEYRNDRPRLLDLYVRASKGVLVLVLPIAVVLFVFAERILGLWMGQDFVANSSTTLRYQAIAFLVASLAATPGVFVEGLGRPGVPAAFAALSAVINLTATLLFIPRYGIAGPALALILNGAITVPIFVAFVNRRVLKMSSVDLMKSGFVRPCAAAAILYLFCVLVAPMAKSLVGLLLLLFFSASFYALTCLALGVFDKVERDIGIHYYKMIFRGGSKHGR